jgi:hypothetical protein
MFNVQGSMFKEGPITNRQTRRGGPRLEFGHWLFLEH